VYFPQSEITYTQWRLKKPLFLAIHIHLHQFTSTRINLYQFISFVSFVSLEGYIMNNNGNKRRVLSSFSSVNKPLAIACALLSALLFGSQAQAKTFNVPSKIEAEDYANYYDADTGNHGGQYRSDNVDIEKTTDTGGGFNIGWTVSNEWLEYSINVIKAGTYTADIRVAAFRDTGLVNLEIDGVNVGNSITINPTKGWQTWVTLNANLGNLTTGNKTLRFQIANAGFNFNWIELKSASTTVTDDELMPESPWTYLGLSASASKTYGTRTFAVPAAQNWVNSGLYLKKGQSVKLSATGQWKNFGSALHSAAGGSEEKDSSGAVSDRGCLYGSLTARIGLYYLDNTIGCIGTGGTYVAPQDGILFLGSIAGTDLGDTYENRRTASGEVKVTATSQGSVVPTIRAADAANFNYDSVTSGWIEVLGKHTILTLPVSSAKQDAKILTASVDQIDSMYESHKSLRGRAPYFGQPIRWIADEAAPGYLLAGNPVRIKNSHIYNDDINRITRASLAGTDYWAYVHELGHTFNFAGGDWSYTLYGGLEAWPNVFSTYTQEKLGLPYINRDCPTLKKKYLAAGKFDDGVNGDPWVGLCFLLEFKQKYGWDMYKKFYTKFNAEPGSGWNFLRTRFSEAAGTDVNAIFTEWKIPK
jgi:Carbohydrate binding module (family 6)/Peptidase M60, enhancin and enhancin-like